MKLALSCAWLAVVVLLITRAVRQLGLLKPLKAALPPEASEQAEKVAVIVPVRDEEANIGRCLRSLIEQNYAAERLHFLIVDDHSTDSTVSVVTSIAQNDPRVCLLRSPPLSPPWIGKSHACWIAARTVPTDTDWLCFIDADVWCEPELLTSAVAVANSEQLDLLSLAPRQQLDSFAERLVMPCGLYLLAFCQDLRKLQSRDSIDTTVTGQFMLVRHRGYNDVGGHAAIRSAICEDVALARLLKRSGKHVVLFNGSRWLSTRMYTGWKTLWIGVSKNLVDMLGGPVSTPVIALAAIVLPWMSVLIPVVDAVSCRSSNLEACWGLLPALTGSAALFGLHIAGAAYFGIPVWYGLLFPLGYTAGALMAFDSLRRRWHGRVTWKGRTYP